MVPDQFLDTLLSLPALEDAGVSPDGRWAAWTWFRAGPAADVYAVPTDGSIPPIRLTNTPENTYLVSWTADSRAVLVQQDQEGDERMQLFRVDLDQPGVMHPLTEEAPNFYLQGGQLHPNGRWLIYGANVDENGEEIEATWVYRHDLETGTRHVLACPQEPAYCDPELNLQGTYILYTRQDLDPAGAQVWMVDSDGEVDREVLNFGADVSVVATWFPDGERVLVLAEEATYRRLGVWSRDTDAIHWLIDDPDRNIERAFVPFGESPVIVIVELQEARARASLLDIGTGSETRLPDVPGNLIPLYPLGTGMWIGEYYSSTHPKDLVRFSLNDLRPEAFVSLTRIWERTAIRSQDLTPAEDFRWRSVDGLEIQGWLYRTQQKVQGTIVFIHSGPAMHSEDNAHSFIQFAVSQGFHVLAPNYRGSTGFSFAYQEAIKQDGLGGREQEDIRTGIEALIAAGIAEPGKIGVTGASYGGYSSWCQITRYPPEIVAAAAPVNGMTDLVVDYETTRPDLRPYVEEMLGGRPDQMPERYYERSPIHFVSNIKGHLLIVQGSNDPNVTPEHVRAVTEALQQAGIDYQVLTFEDEGHDISRPENRKILYAQLASFFGNVFATVS